MDERRGAELLVIRLRWIALITGALMIDDFIAKPLATTIIAGIFCCNVLASHITTDKALFARYGDLAAVAARVLDASAITLAAYTATPPSQNFFLLYGYVIVGTGYAYNRIRPMVIALAGCLALDSANLFHWMTQKGELDQAISPAITHAAAFLALGLVAVYVIALRKQEENVRTKARKLSALFECGTRFTTARDLKQLLDHVLQTAIVQTGAVGGSIKLLDTSTNRLLPTATHQTGN